MKLYLILLLLSTFAFAQGEDFDFDHVDFLKANQSLPDSALMAQAIDSLNAHYEEEGFDYLHGSTNRSPDGAFTLYTFHGIGCGAYCNPFAEAVAKIKTTEGDVYFGPFEDEWVNMAIDSIISIDKARGYYLILGESGGKPRGIESVSCRNACLVQLYPKKLSQVWGISSCTSNFAYEEEQDGPWLYELNYNTQTKIITYAFRWYEEDEEYPDPRLDGTVPKDAGKHVPQV